MTDEGKKKGGAGAGCFIACFVLAVVALVAFELVMATRP